MNPPASLMDVPGFDSALAASVQLMTTTTSDTFRVFSRATVGEAVREVEAVLKDNARIYWRER